MNQHRQVTVDVDTKIPHRLDWMDGVHTNPDAKASQHVSLSLTSSSVVQWFRIIFA